MARCHLSLMLLAVLVALAAASPVPRQSPPATRAASSPLDLLDDMTRSLAPDMADPLPPQHHKLPKRASRNRAAVADEYLLPTNIRPVLYQVEIKPSFTKFTFTGLALIIVNVLETTNKIVLHAKDLQLDASNLDIYDDKTQYYFTAASSVTYDKEHDFATITTRAALKKGGRYQLNIYFDGVLNDDLDGFYRSSYKKSDGSTVWLATTQFETAGARRAFPCWDEPEYKARFYMIVDADSTRTAISNSELIEKKANSDGTTSYSYDGTLPISTYLIAFIVSDFASLSNAAGDFTVWARKDIISGGKFSNEVGEQALKLLGEYTGIPYILPKMEQAAIPDFAAGAMENWGLVTYREEYLIEQPSQTIRIAEYMATTICHELGHQWTGDLITLDWWSHTWLNEGFADYFENYICDQIKPEWHLRDKSVVGDHHRGMEYDALEDEHAMSSPVSSPDDASEKFDRISYSKGGAVVRMWENFLGIDVLKAGMNRYLSIYMFKNTNPEHLFKAIDFEAQKAGVLSYGVSFAEIARTWTEQPGVPVVTAVRDYNSNSLKLSQQRFFYSPPNRASLLAQRWHIPVTVVQQPGADWTNLKPTLWLTPSKDSATLSISKASSAQWVLVNPKEIGYYRVNYDIKNWNLLAKQLTDDHTVIPSASRAQLINDALALARAKQLDYPVALQLFNFLKAEREVAPWQSAVTALSYLRGKLAGTDAWTNFLTVLNKLTASAYSSVGYSGSTDHETRLLRYYVVSYACYAGNSDCIAKANAQLKSWLASSSLTLDSDTQAVSMCYGLRGADATSNFNGLKAKWLAEKDATARAALLAALACAQEDKLTGLLTDAVNKKLTGVSENDVVDIWRAVLNRPEQVGTLFNFAKNNYQQIDSYFSSGSSTSGAVRLLANCIQSITSSAQLEEARYWVESNYNGKTGYQTLQAAFLNTYTQLEWYRSNYKAVADWFATAATA